MNEREIKLAVGFVTYGDLTAKYLPYFLESLRAQTFKDLIILAIDNTETRENENAKILKNYPEIKWQWAGANIGFARAYNQMIREAQKYGVKYFLAINPDIVCEKNLVEKLTAAAKTDNKIAAVQPKILKWDFASNKKTSVVDSFGLRVGKQHRFYDDKQGAIDNASADEKKEIFGFTGAAVLLKLEALNDTAYAKENGEPEFFDELMFMYKEDCDLSYRLRLAGWKIIFEPAAVCWHDRTAGVIGGGLLRTIKNRRDKSRRIKEWSFLNQLILLLKLYKLPFSWRVKLATACRQFKTFFFILFFEPYLLAQFKNLGKARRAIKKRRQALKIRAPIDEIERFMD